MSSDILFLMILNVFTATIVNSLDYEPDENEKTNLTPLWVVLIVTAILITIGLIWSYWANILYFLGLKKRTAEEIELRKLAKIRRTYPMYMKGDSQIRNSIMNEVFWGRDHCPSTGSDDAFGDSFIPMSIEGETEESIDWSKVDEYLPPWARGVNKGRVYRNKSLSADLPLPWYGKGVQGEALKSKQRSVEPTTPLRRRSEGYRKQTDTSGTGTLPPPWRPAPTRRRSEGEKSVSKEKIRSSENSVSTDRSTLVDHTPPWRRIYQGEGTDSKERSASMDMSIFVEPSTPPRRKSEGSRKKSTDDVFVKPFLTGRKRLGGFRKKSKDGSLEHFLSGYKEGYGDEDRDESASIENTLTGPTRSGGYGDEDRDESASIANTPTGPTRSGGDRSSSKVKTKRVGKKLYHSPINQSYDSEES